MAVTDNVIDWPEAQIQTVLRDGTVVHVRPARPTDEAAARAFLGGVSPRALHLRFFGIPHLDRAARSLVRTGSGDWALIARAGLDGEIVAHGACLRLDADTAEVAFLVADAWQGRGLGTVLLRRLAELSERRGITTLVAEVLPANDQMLALCRRSGLMSQVTQDADSVTVRLTAAGPPRALAA